MPAYRAVYLQGHRRAAGQVRGAYHAGDSIASLGLPSDERQLDWFCMKEAVMPWGRFPGADVILGPEMKSTGEVMGIAKSYPEAYAKTQLAIDYKLPDPSAGKVFISVCDRDKRHILSIARILRYLGFDICSTEGTRACCAEAT